MLLYVSIFTILLSLILLYNNWNINKNAIYLALFLISSSFYGIAHYFVVYGKSPFWLAVFYNHFTPLMLLLGPFLLFYVRGTLNDTTALKKIDFFHFIPAIVHLIGIIPYSLQPFSEKVQIATAVINNIDQILYINGNYFYSTAVNFIIRPVLLLSYILYCMYLIWKRFSVTNFDANIPKKQLLISFRWLIILIVSLFFIVSEFLIITFNSIRIKPSVGLVNSYPLYILSGIAYCVMSFSLLLFPNILYGIPKRIALAKEGPKKTKKQKQTPVIEVEEAISLEEDPFFELYNTILKYLEENKPFLNYDFKISDIALDLKVPQNHVSYCITYLMETKFSKLKSELRIKHAINLLEKGSNSKLTIEAIGKKSGFKTRSNFYSTFKEEIGFTPSEYIERLNKSL